MNLVNFKTRLQTACSGIIFHSHQDNIVEAEIPPLSTCIRLFDEVVNGSRFYLKDLDSVCLTMEDLLAVFSHEQLDEMGFNVKLLYRCVRDITKQKKLENNKKHVPTIKGSTSMKQQQQQQLPTKRNKKGNFIQEAEVEEEEEDEDASRTASLIQNAEIFNCKRLIRCAKEPKHSWLMEYIPKSFYGIPNLQDFFKNKQYNLPEYQHPQMICRKDSSFNLLSLTGGTNNKLPLTPGSSSKLAQIDEFGYPVECDFKKLKSLAENYKKEYLLEEEKVVVEANPTIPTTPKETKQLLPTIGIKKTKEEDMESTSSMEETSSISSDSSTTKIRVISEGEDFDDDIVVIQPSSKKIKKEKKVPIPLPTPPTTTVKPPKPTVKKQTPTVPVVKKVPKDVPSTIPTSKEPKKKKQKTKLSENLQERTERLQQQMQLRQQEQLQLQLHQQQQQNLTLTEPKAKGMFPMETSLTNNSVETLKNESESGSGSGVGVAASSELETFITPELQQQIEEQPQQLQQFIGGLSTDLFLHDPELEKFLQEGDNDFMMNNILGINIEPFK